MVGLGHWTTVFGFYTFFSWPKTKTSSSFDWIRRRAVRRPVLSPVGRSGGGGNGGAGTPVSQAAAVCSRRQRTAHVRPALEPNVSRRRWRRPLVSTIYIYICILLSLIIVITKTTDSREGGATASSTYANETRPRPYIL